MMDRYLWVQLEHANYHLYLPNTYLSLQQHSRCSQRFHDLTFPPLERSMEFSTLQRHLLILEYQYQLDDV